MAKRGGGRGSAQKAGSRGGGGGQRRMSGGKPGRGGKNPNAGLTREDFVDEIDECKQLIIPCLHLHSIKIYAALCFAALWVASHQPLTSLTPLTPLTLARILSPEAYFVSFPMYFDNCVKDVTGGPLSSRHLSYYVSVTTVHVACK